MCGRSISSIVVFAVTLAVAIGIFVGSAAAQPDDKFIKPDSGGKDVFVGPGELITGFGSFDPAEAPAVTSNDKFPDTIFDEQFPHTKFEENENFPDTIFDEKNLFPDTIFDDDEEYQDGSDPVVVG